MQWTRRFLVVAVGVAALAAPGSASATTDCVLTGQLLTVEMPSAGDKAQLDVTSNTIKVTSTSGGTALNCVDGLGDPVPAPTTSTVGAISVTNSGSTGNNDVDISSPGLFKPGANPQDGTDNMIGDVAEIEIIVFLGDKPGSLLTIHPRSADDIRIGDGGINTNAGAADFRPDADITLNQAPLGDVIAAGGDEAIGGQGGSGPAGRSAPASPFEASSATTF